MIKLDQGGLFPVPSDRWINRLVSCGRPSKSRQSWHLNWDFFVAGSNHIRIPAFLRLSHDAGGRFFRSAQPERASMRSIVITGASAGIGFAIAERLAKGGWRVAIIARAGAITPEEYQRVTATTYPSQIYGTLAALRHIPRRCPSSSWARASTPMSWRRGRSGPSCNLQADIRRMR